MSDSALRAIPSVDVLIARALANEAIATAPHAIVVAAVRATVEVAREQIRARDPFFGPDYFDGPYFLGAVGTEIGRVLGTRHQSVINATGILLHTGLGRAPLSDAAAEAARDVARYSIVEIDPVTGQRDLRECRVAEHLCELTGAEAATVVNNNAAATMLVLAALGAGREAIASRGELVEIGGGFRMPDVMAASGCRLREVGTTNRTYAKDYADAVCDATGLLLKIHTSNFRVVGFTHSASVAELAALGKRSSLPMVYDLGSGLLRPIPVAPLHDEPTVRAAIADGADVVCFSGDKLLCGPQAGILVGKKRYVDMIRRHPLFRAIRPGKLDLAALEQTLLAYRSEPEGVPDLPLFRMLALDVPTLRARAERLRSAFVATADLSRFKIEIRDSVGFLGSGSAPMREVPGIALTIASRHVGPEDLASHLRAAGVHVRIADDRIWVEMRTLFEDQLEGLTMHVGSTLRAYSGATSRGDDSPRRPPINA